MKTAINFIFLLALVVMAACNNSQPKENHDGHDHGKEAPGTSVTKTVVSLKNDKLNAVYQHYTHLTAALTNGDTAEAKIAATAIELGAKHVEGAENLVISAAKITNASDLEVQRTTFAALSDDLIAMVKRTGLNNGELYVTHCAMAFNNKGANWLTTSKEIKNPYYGENMLTCGSVKETLK